MMNFSLKPTLEHMALVRVTATLWNEHDIRFLLKEFLKSPFFGKVYFPSISSYLTRKAKRKELKKEWKPIENRVKEKVPQLMMPTILKNKILNFIEPIGLEILRWMEYHRKYYSLDLDLPNEFYWTSHGTVDKRKTAAVLINNESINVTTRYKLACIYCLECDIQKLWNEIPESDRNLFYDEDPNKIEQEELIIFWTYFIKGKLAKMDRRIRQKYNRRCSSYQFVCKWAADDGNVEATKYFLQKIPSRVFLVKTAISVAKKRHEGFNNFHRNFFVPEEYYTGVLCFLLSQMNDVQQIAVFKSQPFPVLECFLDSPWQKYFLETAKRVWNFLPNILCYNTLLKLIIENVINGYTDYNYQELFGKLWQQISDADKSSVINDNSIPGLICMLLQIKDEENIKMIFQSASVFDKRHLILGNRGRRICKDMICNDAWDLLKFFIRFCISSKEEIVKFKREFQENISRRYLLDIESFSNNDKLDVFYKLLDDLVAGFDKREYSDSDGDGNCPAKRLCKDLSVNP